MLRRQVRSSCAERCGLFPDDQALNWVEQEGVP